MGTENGDMGTETGEKDGSMSTESGDMCKYSNCIHFQPSLSHLITTSHYDIFDTVRFSMLKNVFVMSYNVDDLQKVFNAVFDNSKKGSWSLSQNAKSSGKGYMSNSLYVLTCATISTVYHQHVLDLEGDNTTPIPMDVLLAA